MNLLYTPSGHLIQDLDGMCKNITDDDLIKWADLCERAEFQIKNKNYENAIKLYEKSMEYYLIGLQSLEGMGRAYALLKNYDKANLYIDLLNLYHGFEASGKLSIARIYSYMGKRWKAVFSAYQASNADLNYGITKENAYMLMDMLKKKMKIFLPWEIQYEDQFIGIKPSKHSRPDRVMNPLYNPITNLISLILGGLFAIGGITVIILYPSLLKEGLIITIFGCLPFIFDKYI